MLSVCVTASIEKYCTGWYFYYYSPGIFHVSKHAWGEIVLVISLCDSFNLNLLYRQIQPALRLALTFNSTQQMSNNLDYKTKYKSPRQILQCVVFACIFLSVCLYQQVEL